MKKLFIATFEYESGSFVEEKTAIVRADSKEDAINIFNNKINNIFNYITDSCSLDSMREVSEGVSLIFTQGGNFWAE